MRKLACLAAVEARCAAVRGDVPSKEFQEPHLKELIGRTSVLQHLSF